MATKILFLSSLPYRIHGAAIYGNMDPINIPPMLPYIYIAYMDPMGTSIFVAFCPTGALGDLSVATRLGTMEAGQQITTT